MVLMPPIRRLQPRVAELDGMALVLGRAGVWRHGGGGSRCVSVGPLSAIP